MPKLKNPFYEKEARDLLKNNFNKTKTYLQNHPKATYDTANSHGITHIVKQSIDKRACEIADEYEATRKDTIIRSLEEDLNAKKALVVNGELKEVRDNAVVLETKKFILKDIYNVSEPQAPQSVTYNLTQVNIERLENIAKDLKLLKNREAQDNAIVDGEVIQ